MDPGLGFAKEADDNWRLLNHLAEFVDLGYPVLIGASRKRFWSALLADTAGQPRTFAERDAATDAVSAIAAAGGVWGYVSTMSRLRWMQCSSGGPARGGGSSE